MKEEEEGVEDGRRVNCRGTNHLEKDEFYPVEKKKGGGECRDQWKKKEMTLYDFVHHKNSTPTENETAKKEKRKLTVEVTSAT